VQPFFFHPPLRRRLRLRRRGIFLRPHGLRRGHRRRRRGVGRLGGGRDAVRDVLVVLAVEGFQRLLQV